MIFRSDSFFVTEFNARREFNTMDSQISGMNRGYYKRLRTRDKEELKPMIKEVEELRKTALASYLIWGREVGRYLQVPMKINNTELDKRLVKKLILENANSVEEHAMSMVLIAESSKVVREAAIKVNDIYIEFMVGEEIN